MWNKICRILRWRAILQGATAIVLALGVGIASMAPADAGEWRRSGGAFIEFGTPYYYDPGPVYYYPPPRVYYRPRVYYPPPVYYYPRRYYSPGYFNFGVRIPFDD